MDSKETSDNKLETTTQDPLESKLENLNLDDSAPQVDTEEYDSDWETDEDDEETVLQLKITLKHTSPKIWRRILVSDEDTIEDLHEYIQEAMGWHCSHMYMFSPAPNKKSLDFSEELELCEYFTEVGDKLTYIYDMGDGWIHEIVLEDIIPADLHVWYPKCVAGKRACPPEDCGGTSGYKHLLKVIADPSHEEHDDMTTWLEDFYPGFDPDEFNPKNCFIT